MAPEEERQGGEREEKEGKRKRKQVKMGEIEWTHKERRGDKRNNGSDKIDKRGNVTRTVERSQIRRKYKRKKSQN